MSSSHQQPSSQPVNRDLTPSPSQKSSQRCLKAVAPSKPPAFRYQLARGGRLRGRCPCMSSCAHLCHPASSHLLNVLTSPSACTRKVSIFAGAWLDGTYSLAGREVEVCHVHTYSPLPDPVNGSHRCAKAFSMSQPRNLITIPGSPKCSQKVPGKPSD